MPFREKSAWAMLVVTAVAGLFYARMVIAAPAAPVIGPVIPYVGLVIVLSIIVQIVLAISSPREANAPADERERHAIDRAGSFSGSLLASGVVVVLGMYVADGAGATLFHGALAALIVAQIAEYALQIWYFRRGT